MYLILIPGESLVRSETLSLCFNPQSDVEIGFSNLLNDKSQIS